MQKKISAIKTARGILALCGLLTALAGCVRPAAAQQIRGVVVDEVSRAPVRVARVRLLQSERVLATTETDEQGRFGFLAPGTGGYRIRADRIGYRTLENVDVTVRAGATTTIELKLAPGPILLDSILVAGRTRERRVGRTEQLIHGRLLDDATREPIPTGTISLLRVDSVHSLFINKVEEKVVATTISNKDGLFRLITPLPGRYTIRAERLGYQTAVSSQLIMMLGDTVRLDFHLSTQAVLLDPIVVRASARPWGDRYEMAGMADFFSRMRHWGGAGHSEFVTREALDKYFERGFTVSRVIDDVMIRPAPTTKTIPIRGAPRMEQGCSGTTMYMDEGPAFDTGAIYNMPLTAFEAMEVHRAPFLPGELMTTFSSSGPARFPCDIIVLWTRRQPKRN